MILTHGRGSAKSLWPWLFVNNWLARRAILLLRALSSVLASLQDRSCLTVNRMWKQFYMDHRHLPPDNIFILRLWRVWSADGPCWRGRIDHLQSGESYAFFGVEGITQVLDWFRALQASDSCKLG
jgi:hypothetical protein